MFGELFLYDIYASSVVNHTSSPFSAGHISEYY
jgi:hypothetical protein